MPVTTISRRLVLLAMAGGAAGVRAQAAYPDKPVKVIVPFSAGGITDIMGRIFADKLQQLLGQAFVIDNRSGAGTRMGTEAVMHAPKDGYTLYFTNATYASLPLTDASAKYDPEKDLDPVGSVATYGLAIVVKNALPVKTLREFIAYARQNPNKLSYGSAGVGSGTHFDGEHLKNQTKIDMVHVPYRSTSLAVQGVASGDIDMAMDGGAKPFVDAGKVRILAVTGAERDPRFPNVPTTTEAGFPNFVVESFMAMFAPAGTRPDAVRTLNQALNTAIADPVIRAKLAEQGMTPVGGAPSDLLRMVNSRITEYKTIMAESNLKFK
ncbi:MAG: tripartite tricarboxylate transporter substrate binding protein [Ramlibacter sp.]|nr:tripartite tricarboxylate transporter substrate binding protein [Ramlibacter sp.]